MSSASESEKKERTKEFWDKEAGTWGMERGIHWTEHLAIQERLNSKITGHIHKDLFQHCIDFFAEKGLKRPLKRGLSLGCGAGEFESALSRYNMFKNHDAYDISEVSIRMARERAEEEGLSHLSFEVRDIERISLPPALYDMTFAIQSVHHFRNLDHIFSEVKKTLRPGGLFVLHEFVGPSRFQWTDRQLEIVNGILKLLPDSYCISRKDGRTLKKRHWRPSIAEMEKVDPSEAIRSDEIVDVLSEYFELIEVKELGGTILQILLDGIAGNFDYNRSQDMRFLKIFFEIEDVMMDIGEISSDFVFIIARNR